MCVALIMMLGMGLSSCSKPRIISDDKLAQIFHDIYLTNAYNQSYPFNLDSLNIYEPVFAKYGYTVEDMQYTIGSFAKRKSARMSNVVDDAIEILDRESRFYQGRLAIYDTVGLIARERYVSVVYYDSLITARKTADTAKLRITLPVKPGAYEVSYIYTQDTTDRNSLRANMYLLDEDNRHSSNNTRRMRPGESEKVSVLFYPGENHRELVLDFNNYRAGMTKPHLTIEKLTVKYYLPDRIARDSMARDLMGPFMIDSLLNSLRRVPPADSPGHIFLPDEKDIVALPADSARAVAR